jgi:hypothetical protein
MHVASRFVDGLERKWLEAQREPPLDYLLADQFVDMGSDGTVRNKAEAIEGQKTLKFISVEYADPKMNVYGNTVIVTGVMNAEGINLASGRNFEITNEIPIPG